MRFVVHAGMHKTGSSSIQQTFGSLGSCDWAYTPFKAVNHCGLFAYLTHPDIGSYHAFSSMGIPLSQLNDDKVFWANRFSEFLESLSGNALFSAEDISVAEPSQVRVFFDLLTSKGIEPQVIIYIRPPISYMASAFQERLKAGELPKLSSNLWPGYRRRVEVLDNVFGRENVKVKPYHPWEFEDNDVVKDFASELGICLHNRQTSQLNKGLSAEAISLLYAQRKQGCSYSAKTMEGHLQNQRWIRILQKVGTTKLVLGPNIFDPIMRANNEDLLWIENRIGKPLQTEVNADGYKIEEESDLLALAERQVPVLREVLSNLLDRAGGRKLTEAVKLLEAIRAFS